MLPIVTDQVYVLRPPIVKDAHGNQSRTTKDWKHAARTGPYDACVQPDSATLGASLATKEQRRGGREQLSKSIQVFLNPDTDVLGTDGLEINGKLWQVNGEPFELPDVGGLGHMILKADWIEG